MNQAITPLRTAMAIVAFATIVILTVSQSPAQNFVSPPFLSDREADGQLPSVENRLPENPMVLNVRAMGLIPGRHGGTLRMAMQKSKDTRQMVVYGYARLVKYDRHFNIIPDILESVDEENGRIFTLHLRKGHKWSDGHPFTAEDFRYWWDDIANNKELYPAGPPARLKISGKFPKVEILDDHTVRYSWPSANPTFLPSLAQASPLYIYAPAHYLRQFHANHTDETVLNALVKEDGSKSWASLHNKVSKSYKNSNPDLPSLQPWVLAGDSDGQRFEFLRNAYFHRIDENRRQLPYIDRWIFSMTEKKLIPLKAATGEIDLQSRNLKFEDISLLKQNEDQYGFSTRLWRTGKGAHMALFPNLNHADENWRKILRDVRFRRALSLAINRYEINRVIYFGLAVEGQNTLLPASPLYKPEYRKRWTHFDLKQANELLDEMGLRERDGRGVRLMPNGEPLEIIVETADAGTEQPDVLQLIADSWLDAGIKLHIKPTSHDVLIPRIYSGQTLMTISSGWENGLATADMAPRDLAPVTQDHYQWPKWGQYIETGGKSGQEVDLPAGEELLRLYRRWFQADQRAERVAIWERMLDIQTDNVFTIGIVAGILQPVVVRDGLINVPEEGMWNWDPGAHFGVYDTDLFWFENGADRS
ncbi:ABC transporter substrate-binding protein [Aestuariispira insulae]|uniref:Peptide/nickel transport system substrate-binding protein n=1 Tax=Aestuariispira insulae TaxID=1461337 RepID=A0A3D9HR07_9PROT|nr:ABC transporter substrate-binding protein [Aestuariispira insulae]RED51336.1 peptide/nickel transport system substrate-binding protein [Aestuariispira insulae]